MKKIWVFIILMFINCTSDNFEQTPTPVVETFDKTENTVTDKSPITFNLEKEGVYNLVLIDGTQVISRERFLGKIGKNSFKLYTRALQVKSLHLVLQDADNNQIGKTTLIIK